LDEGPKKDLAGKGHQNVILATVEKKKANFEKRGRSGKKKSKLTVWGRGKGQRAKENGAAEF